MVGWVDLQSSGLCWKMLTYRRFREADRLKIYLALLWYLNILKLWLNSCSLLDNCCEREIILRTLNGWSLFVLFHRAYCMPGLVFRWLHIHRIFRYIRIYYASIGIFLSIKTKLFKSNNNVVNKSHTERENNSYFSTFEIILPSLRLLIFYWCYSTHSHCVFLTLVLC